MINTVKIKALLRHPRNAKKRKEYRLTREAGGHENSSRFSVVDHNPLISVIIVSHNSADDLIVCLQSLREQSYSNFEVIVIENGTSNTNEVVKSVFPNASWIACKENVGFAAANNLGFSQSQGEFVALVNPDVRLDPDCLSELLFPFRHRPDLAVSVPKIRFWTRFTDYELSASTPFTVDISEIADKLLYKKYFIRSGKISSDGNVLISENVGSNTYRALIRLPLDGSFIRLEIATTSPISCRGSFGTSYSHLPDNGVVKINLDLAPRPHPSSFWVINNAGSDVGKDGPFDIGFGEKDEIFFDACKDVMAFCGCVALIRRMAVLDRQLFRPHFFAYYEDSELSHHLKRKSYCIQYTPRAVVWHRHSSSTVEKSPLWQTLVRRSRLYYDHFTGSPGATKRLRQFIEAPDRYAQAPSVLGKTLQAYDDSFAENFTSTPHVPRKRTIGVYNSYWNTNGGGECHALGVAKAIAQRSDDLYLISEKEFSPTTMAKTFGFDLAGTRKLVVNRMHPNITGLFDIFINATYCSELISQSPVSYYIVSFPQKHIDKRLLATYTFLFNSAFTQSWAKRLWGPTRSHIVYPTFGSSMENLATDQKKKIALSVGRIDPRGHSKNQLEIARAFIGATQKPEYRDWALYVVGNIDLSVVEQVSYLEQLEQLSNLDSRVKIIPNCPLERLRQLRQDCSIYIHAAGLGRKPTEPELHEHFGIAVLDATLAGCYPLVYHIGGPAELVAKLGHGSTFSTEREMQEQLSILLSLYPDYGSVPIAQSALAFCVANKANANTLFELKK